MQGIASLLDDASAQDVHRLWAELERTYGLREAARSVPYPHVSYHLAEDYNLARIGALMRHVARQIAPFTICVTGLGAFTAHEPVLYLAVERSAELNALHETIWRALADEPGAARTSSPLYESASWIPHVTLAQRDLTSGALDSLLSTWSSRDFRREAHVHDLALLYQRPGEEAYAPLERVKLSGPPYGSPQQRL